MRDIESIKGYLLTTKEVDACLELIQKMRAEEDKQRAIEHCRRQFEDLTTSAIDGIGLVETKKIIREINVQLRSLNSEKY